MTIVEARRHRRIAVGRVTRVTHKTDPARVGRILRVDTGSRRTRATMAGVRLIIVERESSRLFRIGWFPFGEWRMG